VRINIAIDVLVAAQIRFARQGNTRIGAIELIFGNPEVLTSYCWLSWSVLKSEEEFGFNLGVDWPFAKERMWIT
jgi:hypothetical protein